MVLECGSEVVESMEAVHSPSSASPGTHEEWRSSRPLVHHVFS